MAFIFDEVWVNNGQLVVGAKNINPPDALATTIFSKDVSSISCPYLKARYD